MSSGIVSTSTTYVLNRKITIQDDHYINMEKHNLIMMVRILVNTGISTHFFSGRGVDHSGSDYMEGCLDTIFIQGQKIDLDQAFFKDISVSSHSCPV